AEPAKELRVFGLGPEIQRRHDELWDEIDRELTATRARASLYAVFGWLVFAAGYIGAIALVAWRAQPGAAGIGAVVLVITLAGQINSQVNAMFFMAGWLTASLKVVGRYLWLEDYAAAKAKLATIERPAPAPERFAQGIELRGVTFRYPDTDVDV